MWAHTDSKLFCTKIVPRWKDKVANRIRFKIGAIHHMTVFVFSSVHHRAYPPCLPSVFTPFRIPLTRTSISKIKHDRRNVQHRHIHRCPTNRRQTAKAEIYDPQHILQLTKIPRTSYLSRHARGCDFEMVFCWLWWWRWEWWKRYCYRFKWKWNHWRRAGKNRRRGRARRKKGMGVDSVG